MSPLEALAVGATLHEALQAAEAARDHAMSELKSRAGSISRAEYEAARRAIGEVFRLARERARRS
jgi:hypothetical protein